MHWHDDEPGCTCTEGDEFPAAPDRPGDREQQQAAEDAELVRIGRACQIAYADGMAAARAEEAARWQAKIEALPAVGTLHGEPVVSLRALRAVLDGER